MLLFNYLHLFIFLLLALLLFYISIKFKTTIGEELINIFIFPAIFLIVNYAFIKLLLGFINFYNDLLVIHDGQLIVIKSSLLFKDDIEFIDINKITKLDTYCRGIIPNILSFGNLVVEQQRDQVREFHFVPNLYKALQLINNEKQRTIEERKKTYVVSKSNMKKIK